MFLYVYWVCSVLKGAELGAVGLGVFMPFTSGVSTSFEKRGAQKKMWSPLWQI